MGIPLLAPTVLGLLAWTQGADGARSDQQPAGPVATLALADIRASIAQSRARLRSLFVEHDTRGRDPETGAWEEHAVRRVIAARGPLRFAETYHYDVHFPPDLDLKHDAVYYTGETLDLFCLPQRYFETTRRLANSPYSYKVRCEFYLEAMGWWPPDDTTQAPPMAGKAFFLQDALNDPECHISDILHNIDGSWCYLVERPGVDRMWFDPALGFALKRREWFSGRPPSLSRRYELSDYREEEPGVWLPRMIRRVGFRPPGSAAAVGGTEVETDSTAHVLRAEVNRVSEQQFQFRPLPGLLVMDLDTKEVHQVPGGLSFLNEVVELARRRAEAYKKSGLAHVPIDDSAQWGGPWGLVALISVTVAEVVFIATVFIRAALGRRDGTSALPGS